MRLFTFLWVMIPLFLSSQPISPVSWSFDLEKISETEFDLVFTADIDDGWSVYSQFIAEGGPFPTTITYETEGHELTGIASEEGYRKEGMDPIFNMNVIKFMSSKPYVIRQTGPQR